MMKLGDYDINTRLQKFLAETNEISGVRSTIETQTAWMTPHHARGHGYGSRREVPRHQAPPDH